MGSPTAQWHLALSKVTFNVKIKVTQMLVIPKELR